MPSNNPANSWLPAAAAIVVVAALVAAYMWSREPSPPPGPRPVAGGELEISGVAHVPGTNKLLVLDDDTPGEIFLVEVGPDSSEAGETKAIPLGADVTDMEGITHDGTSFYVVGSQSKPIGFDGDGLARFSFDPASRRITSVETIRDLKGWLAENVAELRGTGREIGDHVLNIEALAWDPKRRRLLLGLRAPVVDGHALVVPVRLVDPSGRFSRDNIGTDGPAIRVDLGGDGIRSLEYDPDADAYRLITGAVLNEETSDFRIVEWSGDDRSPVREIARYSRELKPEGITNAVLHGVKARVLVFDVGTFLLVD